MFLLRDVLRNWKGCSKIIDRARQAYDKGYKDGFRKHDKMSASMLECNVQDYMDGYAKGLSDKEFSEDWSDEALGVEGYGP